MYSEKAIELIKELKRTAPTINLSIAAKSTSSQRLGALPVYNNDTVRKVIEEICALYNEIHSTISNEDREALKSPFVACRLIVHHSSISRNKRCLLAYLLERLKRIQKIRWEYGPVLPKHIKESSLSADEIEFFKKYSHNLNMYMKTVKLDLTSDLQPPKCLYVEVRCLVDHGEIQTENGVVNLTQNSQHYLRKKDVEPLIKQGILAHVE
eukprot:Nk52_evm2s343 gene=Nk52_evmTU2s343